MLQSAMISWSNRPISLDKFISISRLVEIIGSEWPLHTLMETTGWWYSYSRFALLHVLERLPDLLTFGTCALENLVCHWIIRNYRLGLVHHFGFGVDWFILFVFSNDSDVLQACWNWEDIEEWSVRHAIRHVWILIFHRHVLLRFQYLTVIYHIYVRLFCVYSVQVVLAKTIGQCFFEISTK